MRRRTVLLMILTFASGVGTGLIAGWGDGAYSAALFFVFPILSGLMFLSIAHDVATPPEPAAQRPAAHAPKPAPAGQRVKHAVRSAHVH